MGDVGPLPVANAAASDVGEHVLCIPVGIQVRVTILVGKDQRFGHECVVGNPPRALPGSLIGASRRRDEGCEVVHDEPPS